MENQTNGQSCKTNKNAYANEAETNHDRASAPSFKKFNEGAVPSRYFFREGTAREWLYQDVIRKNHKGILYVVATPIGNLSDLTIRALEVLKKVDWVACEDTRRTLKLLNHYGVEKPLLSIFGSKEKKETAKILHLLAESKSVALLSDAGTPGISDPGSFIVCQVREHGFSVEPIPGASALSCAVSVSGCCENGFLFLGFLHRRTSRLKKELIEAKRCGQAIVFFESPFRIFKTLASAAEILGENSFCWIGREMTKRFEEQLSGSLGEILEKVKSKKMLGEFTVILKPIQND